MSVLIAPCAGRVCPVNIPLEPMDEATGINSSEAALSIRIVYGEFRRFKAVCKDQRHLEREKKTTIKKLVTKILTLYFNNSFLSHCSLIGAKLAEVFSMVDWHHVEECQRECVVERVCCVLAQNPGVRFGVFVATCFVITKPGKKCDFQRLWRDVTRQSHIFSTLCWDFGHGL